MRAFADRFGADLRRDAITRVEPDGRAVELASGDELAYDTLVLAVGARAHPAYQHAITFGAGPRSDELWLLLRELGSGVIRSVAFVVPSQTSWPLPLYELALMTAREGRRRGADDLHLEVISPESAPLDVFGPQASDAVASLLAQAEVAFVGRASAEVSEPRTIHLTPGGEEKYVDRIVSLPLLDGPRIPGVPADEHGFIPVDEHGRVENLDDVYAAGDATTFPVKQGGLACQQADAVAEHVAARVVEGVETHPFRAVLRGKLLTGRGAEFLRKGPADVGGPGSAADFELWSPRTKVSGRYLSQWLLQVDGADAERALPRQEGDIEVAVPLGIDRDLHQRATALDP